MPEKLPTTTHIGVVSLTVGNLERSVIFYRDNLGFALLESTAETALVGAWNRPLFSLSANPGARRVPKAAGLYHTAVLVPSRLELARTLHHLADTNTNLGGVADHGVSEALYLSDPDGNGIEIYYDRPREEWPRRPGGTLEMFTDPLDVDGLIGELHQPGIPSWTGIHPDTVIGHIHLQVTDLEKSLTFYTDTLGFDLVMRYGPAAAFVSAGGYHHHVGMNTWASAGAPAAPNGSAGLRFFEIRLPDDIALQAVIQRLQQAGVMLETRPGGTLLHDPSGIGVLLAVD